MADAYWRIAEARQQPALPPSLLGKRARPEFDEGGGWRGVSSEEDLGAYEDAPGGHDLPNFYGRDDERGAPRGMRVPDSLVPSYDRYFRGPQLGPYGRGEPARPLGGGLSGRPIDDPRIMGMGGSEPAVSAKHQLMGVAGGRPEIPLPPDATGTLFVEGLPPNCSRREVAHIFRPFVGYKEVRLVTKDSRHSGGDPLVLCFVDFLSPAHAATAMDALQGYRFDEHDRDSVNLRLQFSRHPGARSGGGNRGRR